MNKIVFTSLHKTGSTVLEKILYSISESKINKKTYIINEPTNQTEVHFTRNSTDYQLYDVNDSFIFVIRNPVSICVSKFYSYGYTHVKPPHQKLDDFLKHRELIVSLGLTKFVELNLNDLCDTIENIMNLQYKNLIILPYELMVTNFDNFIFNLLTFMKVEHLQKPIVSQWSGEFKPIRDLSSKIVAGKSTSHKRTTDIYDWKKKLDEGTLNEYFTKYPVIERYEQFLDQTLSNITKK